MKRSFNISEEARRARSELMKRLNADPGFAAKRNAGVQLVASKRMKRLNSSPEFRKAASERMKRLNADPEFAAKRDAASSERMKQLNASNKASKIRYNV